MSKSYSVSAFFPEVVPAHAAEQVCRIEASNLGLAAKRGIEQMRKREVLKGKRLTAVKLTVLLIGEAETSAK